MKNARRWLPLRFGGVLLLFVLSIPAAAARAETCDLREFERRFHELVEMVQPGVVGVVAYSDMGAPGQATRELNGMKETVGSGVVINDHGHVLTTTNVIGNSRHLYVRDASGRQHRAVYLGADRRTNLALLVVSESALVPVRMGDSSSIARGEWLVTVGQPHSVHPDRSFGALQSRSRGDDETGDLQLLQTTAPLFPGQSGGALANLAGEVVGLVLGALTDGDETNDATLAPVAGPPVSAAIPIETATRVAAMLAEHGTASPGYLGVLVRMPTPALKKLLRFDEGVLIEQVIPNSPAAIATLEAGDIILAFDSVPVAGPTKLMHLVGDRRPGERCVVQLLRGDAKIPRYVTLGVAPEPAEAEEAVPTAAVTETPEDLERRLRELKQQMLELEQRLEGP